MGNPIPNLEVSPNYFLTRDPDWARGQALSISSLISIGTPYQCHQNGQKSP